MSDTTKIQWADATFSPWRGCRKISPGCANCYIYGTTPLRVAGQKSGSPRIRAKAATWRQPVKWNKTIQKLIDDGQPYLQVKVFPSLCDWLDDEVPIEWLVDFLKLVHATPNLDWLLLTKRPENFTPRIMEALHLFAATAEKNNTNAIFIFWLRYWVSGEAPLNVWFGISAENQECLEKRWNIAKDIPARVRFISAEPLLGPLNFQYATFNGADSLKSLAGLHWVIFGGESGDKARPCNIQWIIDGVNQCQDAGVAPFVKQLGSFPICDNANRFDFSETAQCVETDEAAGFAACRIITADKKGGDISEWPAELQVREFPKP